MIWPITSSSPHPLGEISRYNNLPYALTRRDYTLCHGVSSRCHAWKGGEKIPRGGRSFDGSQECFAFWCFTGGAETLLLQYLMYPAGSAAWRSKMKTTLKCLSRFCTWRVSVIGSRLGRSGGKSDSAREDVAGRGIVSSQAKKREGLKISAAASYGEPEVPRVKILLHSLVLNGD